MCDKINAVVGNYLWGHFDGAGRVSFHVGEELRFLKIAYRLLRGFLFVEHLFEERGNIFLLTSLWVLASAETFGVKIYAIKGFHVALDFFMKDLNAFNLVRKGLVFNKFLNLCVDGSIDVIPKCVKQFYVGHHLTIGRFCNKRFE